MSTELSLLLGSIAGGTGALLSFWAGWRARGDVMRIRGGVFGRQPLIFTEGRTIRGNRSGGPTTPKPEIVPNPQPPPRRRSNPFVSEFQQQINDRLGLEAYGPITPRHQPTPTQSMTFPPLSEQRCSNCRYFRADLDARRDGYSRCRRNPPQIAPRGEQWPTVEPDDWCGQWVAQEDQP